MPKKEGPVWKHFTKVTVEKDGQTLPPNFRCNYCNFNYTTKNSSKKELATTCNKVPSAVKLQFQQKIKKSGDNSECGYILKQYCIYFSYLSKCLISKSD